MKLIAIPDFTDYFAGDDGYIYSGVPKECRNQEQRRSRSFLSCVEGIVYSSNKYRETEGSKDIGVNGWNAGKQEEISNRYKHLDDIEYPSCPIE